VTLDKEELGVDLGEEAVEGIIILPPGCLRHTPHTLAAIFVLKM
jgi:hypothetical protein